MKFTLDIARYEEKELLRNLMQLYLYDFSEIESWDVDAQGRFDYLYFDHYWTEAGRTPFLLRVDKQLAGFVLVNQYCHSAPEDTDCYSVAEFFILRKYRRRGLGQQVAHAVFDRFGPRWEVCQTHANQAAQAFWLKAIETYTNGNFQNHPEGYGDFKGVMQCFRKPENNERPA